MEAADVESLKALELENSRLKKLLAERDPDVEILQEINEEKGAPTGSARATSACLHDSYWANADESRTPNEGLQSPRAFFRSR